VFDETFISAMNGIAYQLLEPYLPTGKLALVDRFQLTHPVENVRGSNDGNHFRFDPFVHAEIDQLLQTLCRDV
jgi:hypothetical protein